MKKTLLVLAVVTLLFSCRSTGSVKPGASLSKYSAIVISDFSLEGTKIQANPDVEVFAKRLPANFAAMVKDYLDGMGIFRKVVLKKNASSVAGTEYLVLTGKFTKITAGSTAARWVVGFGAGASTVGAKWEVRDGRTGKVLGSWEKNRHTSGAYRGMTAVESDARHLARDVAVLLKRSM